MFGGYDGLATERRRFIAVARIRTNTWRHRPIFLNDGFLNFLCELRLWFAVIPLNILFWVLLAAELVASVLAKICTYSRFSTSLAQALLRRVLKSVAGIRLHKLLMQVSCRVHAKTTSMLLSCLISHSLNHQACIWLSWSDMSVACEWFLQAPLLLLDIIGICKSGRILTHLVNYGLVLLLLLLLSLQFLHALQIRFTRVMLLVWGSCVEFGLARDSFASAAWHTRPCLLLHWQVFLLATLQANKVRRNRGLAARSTAHPGRETRKWFIATGAHVDGHIVFHNLLVPLRAALTSTPSCAFHNLLMDPPFSMLLQGLFGFYNGVRQQVGVAMCGAFDNSNAFLAKDLPVSFINLPTLPTDHIALECLCVHIAHTSHALFAIALPLWLTCDLPFAVICLILLLFDFLGARHMTSLSIETLKNFCVLRLA